MSEIYLMEAASLFLGDEDPSASKHLSLDSLALPTLEYVTVDHLGGGAPAEIDFSMAVLRKMNPTFKIAGFDADAYRLFGVGSAEVQTFTARGIIRAKSTGKGVGAVAIMRGSLGKVGPDAFERANKLGHDHQIIELQHYELKVGGQEWFYYDYFSTVRRRFGKDETAEYRQLLGLA